MYYVQMWYTNMMYIYGGGEWCQNFFWLNLKELFIKKNYNNYFCQDMPWKNIIHDSMKKE